MNRDDAISAARALTRTFGSAPDPRERCRAVLRLFESIVDLEPQQTQEMEAFRTWLASVPPAPLLEHRCRRLLRMLG